MVVGCTQRGMALLTVLFILVLLTSISVYMVEDEHLALRRIENMRDLEQAFQLTAGAEQWAVKVLIRDMLENETDNLAETWNRLLPEVGVEVGTLSAAVIDQQGLFNINNLQSGRDETWYPAFKRLLQLVDLDEELADAVIDWIDPDQDVTGSLGAEDAEYLGGDPSYRAANRRLTDIGELLWVAGFDADKLTKLAPFITALPEANTAININTCPTALYRILANDLLDEGAAEQLMQGRGETGYESVESFLQESAMAGSGDSAESMVDVSSKFFRVIGRSEFGRLQLTLHSLLQRQPQQGVVVVLQRNRSLT